MLIIFEAADLNLDFLSVRILCSTLARTDSQETLLIGNTDLEFKFAPKQREMLENFV